VELQFASKGTIFDKRAILYHNPFESGHDEIKELVYAKRACIELCMQAGSCTKEASVRVARCDSQEQL